MAMISLLPVLVFVMVSLALAHHTGKNTLNEREKRELLVRSKRRWDLSTFEIVEEDLGPFPKVVTHMFNDKINLDTQVFHLSGNGADEEPVGVFSIGLKNGSLTQHKRIDREKNSHFYMMFDILNDDRSKGDLTLKFNVAVKDINDNPPIFEHPVMTESITENSPEGYLPVQLIAIDRDQENTDNSNFKISLLSQDPAEPKISVKHVEGTKMSQLTLTGCFNYDKAKKYKLVVEAKDRGEPALSSEAVVYLDVVDSNTHPPVFKENIYKAEIKEMESNKEIVRVAVTDADTPNTPGWRAVYSIVKGNEDGNYKIVTDPKTNEGVLSVIKGKDFERTTLTNVQIAVENEEPLFVCPSGQDTSLPRTQTVNVTVKVIDVNDPPEFKENITKVYVKEEDQPGKVLYKPTVIDVDSDVKNIRYELVDPAGWVTIDPKTGAVTTVKPMDRESSYVNKDNIYTILVRAIDDGEPPATATGTVLIHLGDINDNIPHVVKKELVMCGNKVNVTVEDKDQSPYGCPCSFSLGADKNKNSLKSLWKLNPANGMEVGLVSLKSLPYGNYTVPLVVQDQQGQVGNSTVHVLVCDCGEVDICRALLPRTSTLGWAAIGLLLAGLLLLLLLLLFCLQCECGRAFSKIPVYLQDEGNQTLIKYNEEGGGSACKSEPMLTLTATPPNFETVDKTDCGMQQTNQSILVTTVSSSGGRRFSREGTFQRVGEANGTQTSQIRRGRYQTWNSSRRSTVRANSSKYTRSFSLLSDQSISERVERGLYMIGNNVVEQPHIYANEGTGSKCQSLEQLSLSNLGDDLEFLGDLGSKFNTLGRICTQDMEEKGIKL
ncbi:cadherin-like protein 26 [Esox lucius]|uniref:cadherin-like protein 26 n=1 Tax=Esox lucius TaxID=8010 RepID=UPI001476B13A|nr:cadherin-like protein 26 [Esox lucius]